MPMRIIKILSVGPLAQKTKLLRLNVSIKGNPDYTILIPKKEAITLARDLNNQPFINPQSEDKSEPE